MNFSPVDIACFSTAVAFAGWLFIPRLTRSINSASHRTRFHNFILRLIDKTKARYAGEFAYYHPEKTVTEFDAEVLNVKGHIHKRYLIAFDKACGEYRSVEFTVMNDKKNADAKTKLLAILNELLRYAK